MAQSNTQTDTDLMLEFLKARPEFQQFVEQKHREFEKEQVMDPSITSLCEAINGGNIETAIQIATAMTPEVISQTDSYGESILHYITPCENNDICELLISKASTDDLLRVRESGETAFHLALQRGYTTFADCALRIRSDLIPVLANIVNTANQVPLHSVAGLENINLTHAVFEHTEPEHILAANEEGWTVLHDAARCSDVEFIHLLLSNESIREKLAESKDKYGQTALHIAASQPDVETLRVLYDVCDMFAKDDRGYNALHFAAQTKNTAIVDFILNDRHTASGLFYESDNQGQTCLHWAASLGSTDICQQLIDFSQRYSKSGEASSLVFNQTTESGYTALHLAVHARSNPVVAVLVSDPKIGSKLVGTIDKYGQTPLIWAASFGCADICKTLCKVMTADQLAIQAKTYLNTALHSAVYSTNAETLAVILDYCTSTCPRLFGIKDSKGKTAIDYAEAMKDHPELEKLIVVAASQ